MEFDSIIKKGNVFKSNNSLITQYEKFVIINDIPENIFGIKDFYVIFDLIQRRKGFITAATLTGPQYTFVETMDTKVLEALY